MDQEIEYVIVFTRTGLYWSDKERSRVELDRATLFSSVAEAASYLGTSNDPSLKGPDHLTIHRVVREPARVEEVPLREALNEGLPLVAAYQKNNGERRYHPTDDHAPGTPDIAVAKPFASVSGLLQWTQRYAVCVTDIVGVRDVPGKITTVEVA